MRLWVVPCPSLDAEKKKKKEKIIYLSIIIMDTNFQVTFQTEPLSSHNIVQYNQENKSY